MINFIVFTLLFETVKSSHNLINFPSPTVTPDPNCTLHKLADYRNTLQQVCKYKLMCNVTK